ncbi:divalent-cation tolerance protein CutA [Herpetosiphon geysericola]|uniref:Cytochrome C biogenesis protein CcdA n=1 Tax=Herpetosiphon geysericola TaxID=70996 RepID=A0A0N8GRK5_9CHLR|nr:divalent-cation tolerance protein CutA [Herpetosiphon geysericola]KPL86754.1 cytochrome C biogenesis protein CcdA [Herpetosiphon geysericola]
MSDAAQVVLISTSNADEARTLALALVTERLAASVNILPQMSSIYHWEGILKEEAEILLIVRTRADALGSLIERVEQLHSYALPEIIALPIVDGSQRFINWILGEVMTNEDA